MATNMKGVLNFYNRSITINQQTKTNESNTQEWRNHLRRRVFETKQKQGPVELQQLLLYGRGLLLSLWIPLYVLPLDPPKGISRRTMEILSQ
jgi:hypothetical protein